MSAKSKDCGTGTFFLRQKTRCLASAFFSLLIIICIGLALRPEAPTLAQEAMDPPITGLDVKCLTEEGRQSLRDNYPPHARQDMRFQALALGLDPEAYIPEQISRDIADMCAYTTTGHYADGTVPVFTDEIFVQINTQVERCISCGRLTFTRVIDPTFEKDWQICDINFVTHHSSSNNTLTNLPKQGRATVKLAQLLDDDPLPRYQGVTVTLEALYGNYMIVANMNARLIPAKYGDDERIKHGCYMPAKKDALKLGGYKCDEKRGTTRSSDTCVFDNQQIDDTIRIDRVTARKLIVSKPADDGGEEILEVHNIANVNQPHPDRTIILKPGDKLELLSKSGATFTHEVLVVKTVKVGENKRSSIKIMTEWY